MTSPKNPEPFQDDWPDFPQIEVNDPQAKVKEILFQAQVDLAKAKHMAMVDLQKIRDVNLLERQQRTEQVEQDQQEALFDADVEIHKSTLTHEQELEKAVHAAYIEIAKGQIDRIQVRADFVQKAAATIVTLYTGVLTLVFAVEKNPLPVRGLIPAIFLGLAIVFSATYFAFVTRPKNMPHAEASVFLPEKQRRRLDRFIEWSRAPALQRRYFL